MAGELPPYRAAARPLAVLLGCLTAACAPAIGAFRSEQYLVGFQAARPRVRDINVGNLGGR
jgi:hypothetical protein